MSNSMPAGILNDATPGRADRTDWNCRPGSLAAGERRRSNSRKKRKRDRRRAEATAPPPAGKGGWGNGLPISLSDLLLVRRAIREGWPTPQPVRDAVVRDVTDVALLEVPESPRRFLAAVKVCTAMEGANQDAEFKEQGRKMRPVRRCRLRRHRRSLSASTTGAQSALSGHS